MAEIPSDRCDVQRGTGVFRASRFGPYTRDDESSAAIPVSRKLLYTQYESPFLYLKAVLSRNTDSSDAARNRST